MTITRQYPIKGFQVDCQNQSKAIELANSKEKLVIFWLLFGGLGLLLALVFGVLGFTLLFKILIGLIAVSFVGIAVYSIIAFPKTYCSKCNKKMKSKSVPTGGGYEAIFLICEECKLYVDTGHESG